MRTFDTLTRTNLEFPLPRHNLSVNTGDLDSGKQASLVVRLDDISAVDLSCPHTTVIRTLGTWETALGPAVWPTVRRKESVFLLETEPEIVFGISLHQPLGLVTVVELVWASIGIPGLAKNEDVVTATEWIRIGCDGSDVDVRVVAWSLASRRAVKIPFA